MIRRINATFAVVIEARYFSCDLVGKRRIKVRRTHKDQTFPLELHLLYSLFDVKE